MATFGERGGALIAHPPPLRPGRQPAGRRRLQLGLAAAAGIALVTAQQTIGSFGHSALAEALHNAMHFPWGMLLALILWILLRPLSRSPRQRGALTLLAALTVTMGTEVAQLFNARYASLEDMTWNAAGVISTLGLIWAFRFQRSCRLSAVAVLITALLAAWSFAPVAYQASVRWYLNGLLPDLMDLDTALGRAPITFDSRITLEETADQQRVVAVRLEDVKWSGITIKQIAPDWTGHAELIIEAALESRAPVVINARLAFDGYQGPIHAYLLNPGDNRIRLPFAEDLAGQRVPPVRAIILYAAERDSAGAVLYLRRAYLG